jgi:hypothetical protein
MRRFRRIGLLSLGVWSLLVPAARAADKAAIDRATDRGVAYLRKIQQEDGKWVYPAGDIGATCLAALTLLECNVPADDPAVRKATQVICKELIQCRHTYSVSLGVLFLDRLGNPADVPLIRSLGARLVAGQTGQGGWSYMCPEVSPAEAQRLLKILERRDRDGPRGGEKPPPPANGQTPQGGLAPAGFGQADAVQASLDEFSDDNSNTPFAILALWVARRHGLNVDGALARVDRRFRASQNADGGWGYVFKPRGAAAPSKSTPAMTCAGLLGLGVGHANRLTATPRKDVKPDREKKADDLADDPVVRAGFIALGTAIGHPAAKAGGRVQVLATGGGYFYYFLWSLERVAVAYGLDTIGEKDWYGWGSELLLVNQHKDGGWHGMFADGGADTCFALLFLQRANLARDLTARLKGAIADPGGAVLKGGGVGGAAVAKLGLASALETAEKPAEDGAGTGGKRRPAGADGKDKPPAGGSEAARLRAQLLTASGAEQRQILDKLKEGRGSDYTQELAAAIPRLAGESKNKARDALAERVARMTSATVGDKLRDEDLEIRRAAALACEMKDDRAHVARLIDLLDDPEPPVARAAHVALKGLTRQDFGPPADATRAERAQAVASWKAWWAKQQK